MQRKDVHVPGRAGAQASDNVVDLAGPGQEDQHITVLLGQGLLHGGGDVSEELARHPARPQTTGPSRRRPHLLHGVEAAGNLHQRRPACIARVARILQRAAQDVAQAIGVERGGHGHEREVLAQGGACVCQER